MRKGWPGVGLMIIFSRGYSLQKYQCSRKHGLGKFSLYPWNYKEAVGNKMQGPVWRILSGKSFTNTNLI